MNAGKGAADQFEIHKDHISVVITLKITPELFEYRSRLESLCSALPQELFEVTIVDYGTPPAFRPVLESLAQSGLRVVSHPSPHKVFSIGAARDYGAQMSHSPVLLFLDIDFHASSQTFRGVHDLARERSLFDLTAEFACIPVLFLTERGTALYRHSADEGTPFLLDPTIENIEKNTEVIAFPSYGSSAILVNRRHYMAMGGHHHSFKGHGAEDFELLHRLSSLAPWGERPEDYYSDTRIKTFNPLSGFRPYFARYALPALEKGIFLVHRHHPKREEPGYLRQRRNFSNLAKLMKRYDATGEHPLPLADPKRKDGLVVIARRDDPDFARIRPIATNFAAYHLIDEDALDTLATLRQVISRTGANTVLVRSSYGAKQRVKIHELIETLNLRKIVF